MDLREIKEFIHDFMGYIITFILIVLIYTFVISFQLISGNSMSPYLNDGEIIVVSKLSYELGDIDRNDVVSLKVNKKRYAKRIIGLPGETIDYLNGALYINGESFKETLIDEKNSTNNFMFIDICSKELCPNNKIPKDYYLVLGDNREDSQDSRDPEIGLISKKSIEGKIIFRIWPIGDFGNL